MNRAMQNVTSQIIKLTSSNKEYELTDRRNVSRTTVEYVVISNETKNWWRYGIKSKSMTLSQSIKIVNRTLDFAGGAYLLQYLHSLEITTY